MYCGRCGTQNDDNARFCSECGADLSPVNPAAVPVQPVQPVQPIQPIQLAPAVVPIAPTHINKNNVLCCVGFYGALASIVLLGTTAPVFFVISIIGLIQSKKKNELGRGLAKAGIIITSVLMFVYITGIILGLIQRDY